MPCPLVMIGGMKQSDLALRSHRVTVRMTGPMLANLRRLAGTDRRIGEEIRNAIRLYLDDKGTDHRKPPLLHRCVPRRSPSAAPRAELASDPHYSLAGRDAIHP